MEFLNLLLQFSTLTLLALILLFSLRDCCRVTQRLIISGLAVSTGAYLLAFNGEAMHVAENLRRIAVFVHVPNLVFVWFFGLILFEDGFKFCPLHAALSLIYIIPGFVICAAYPDSLLPKPTLAHILLNFYGLLLMGHLIYKLGAGYKDDLIDNRRRARLLFVGALVVVTIAMSFAEINLLPLPANILKWVKLTALFVMSLWVLLWVARFDMNVLLFRSPAPLSPPSPDTGSPLSALDDPRDEALKLNLMSIMDESHIYSQQGLTIKELADALNAPEHRLRHVINKGLGYRNFSAFLNSYRITAIKTALKDPAKARLPILTLAMDYGYNSLAPFNRAFRESEGMTPSEYRRALSA